MIGRAGSSRGRGRGSEQERSVSPILIVVRLWETIIEEMAILRCLGHSQGQSRHGDGVAKRDRGKDEHRRTWRGSIYEKRRALSGELGETGAAVGRRGAGKRGRAK